ncbi:MAG: type II toxin-antitoxin system HicB family antitoxin [Selenomonadaceae bacterium]|nr:type II toxin-antitoxin system HicB family antitoxin [Selenomonadaceae bacterium]
MQSTYPAIFFHEKNGHYSVVFPDLNHLSTCGDTIEEATEMAVDCLAGYLHSEKLDGNTIPSPTPIDKVDIHAEDDEGDDYEESDRFISMISVNVEEYARLHFDKAVRKSLTIPKWLNDMAISRKINFSKLLQKALIKEMKIKVNV